VEVTVTNEADLLGYVVRWEMLAAAIEPTAGQFTRLWTPGNGDNPFDLPPVCAGSVVWVRGRVESPTGEIGQWSAFQSEDLPDLTIPSSLETVVHGTQVTLTWTNGEDDLPIEVLYRLDGDTEYTTTAVLAAGSTTYTWTLPDAEADYNLALRYRAGPGGCTSLVATTDVTTEINLDLSAPINPTAWANGAGTFGMECDGTAFPSSTEFWVAVETAVGSGLSGTYVLSGELVTTPERMRFTHPFVAANDGMLRFLIARHRRGTEFSAYTEPVSINPWTLVDPPEPPIEEPPTEGPGLTETPVEIVLCGATLPIRLWEVPEEETAVEDDGASQDKFPLGQFTHARIVGVTKSTTLPETAVIAAQFELPEAPDDWQYLDGVSGPLLEIGPTAVDTDTEKAREGVWIQIIPEAMADVRLRGVIVGGDEDAGKAVVLARHVLQLVAQSTSEVEPPEMEEEAPEDPGSCTVPSPIDMDTGWAETGGGAGNVWSAQSDTHATLTLDGGETGANYWEKELTGLEPDELYTIYLDTLTDTAGLGTEPFLTVVTGDTDTADEEEDILVARGTTDCDGNLTVQWGVADSAGGVQAASSDDMDYANQAAAEAAGWTVTDIDAEWSFSYDTGHEIAGSGLPTSMTIRRAAGFGGMSVSSINMARTFNVGAGATVSGAIWMEGSGSRWAAIGMTIENTTGSTSASGLTDGNDGVEYQQTGTVTATGDGLITVTISGQASNINYGTANDFYFSGLELLGAGSGSVVQFDDLRMCLGTGIGDEGTNIGGDPDNPGNEPIPDPPVGGWPDPPTPLTRIFGIHDIPSEGLAYWTNTVKVARADNVVNLINSARTAGSNLFLRMGNDADWDSGSRFSYDRWEDMIEEVYQDTRARAALETAIADGTASAHYIIDEPYHPIRYGGPIPFGTVERMFVKSKTLFPTWRTILRVDPTMDWLARAIVGCDTYWAEYLKARGPIDAYVRGRTEAAQDLGGDLVWGIHYAAFDRSGTPRDITPDEMRHYGGLLARACRAYGIGLCGWKYTSSMFRQSGMPEAVRYVRDLLASG
jgi:hypothetical protein